MCTPSSSRWTDNRFPKAIIRSERGNVKHVTGARGRESAEWHNSIGVIRDVLERMEPYTRAVVPPSHLLLSLMFRPPNELVFSA